MFPVQLGIGKPGVTLPQLRPRSAGQFAKMDRRQMAFMTPIVRVGDRDPNLFVRGGNIETVGIVTGETRKQARQFLLMNRLVKILLDG